MTEIPATRLARVACAVTILTAAWAWTPAALAESDEAAETLANPLPYNEETIAEGREHYLRHCQTCHGADGRALENIDFEASDLTAPDTWLHGATDGHIFVNTRDGAGWDMPPFKKELEEREIWTIVNFLRSIGPTELRPDAAAPAKGD